MIFTRKAPQGLAIRYLAKKGILQEQFYPIFSSQAAIKIQLKVCFQKKQYIKRNKYQSTDFNVKSRIQIVKQYKSCHYYFTFIKIFKVMQGDNFSQYNFLNMQLPKDMENKLAYEQYKKEAVNYQKMEAIKELIDGQISLFVHQSDFRQQAKQFYEHVKKISLKQVLPEQQLSNLAEKQDMDGIRFHFVCDKQANIQQSMMLQHEGQRMVSEQPIDQQEIAFLQVYDEYIKRHTIHFFEKLQHEIIPGEQKNLIPYLEKRKITMGMLRRLLRDCIKNSLVYQSYLGQMNHQYHHEDNCCQRQKEILTKIYEMHTQALNRLFPEGKQALLRQLFEKNYEDIFDRRHKNLKQIKKIDKKSQKKP